MSLNHRPTICEINLKALGSNWKQARQKVPPDVTMLAIIKANAYGHGAIACAKALWKCGARHFGVATIEEGIELRKSGLKGTIFVLGGLLSKKLAVFEAYKLTPILHHPDEVARWGKFVLKRSKKIPVHIKMDTGMGRLGLLPEDTKHLLQVLAKNPKVKVEGLFTHLARADEPDQSFTESQLKIFEEIRQFVFSQRPDVKVYHVCNSAALMDGRAMSGMWVRPGIMLYGAYPNPRQQKAADLLPVMSLKTRIISLKKYPMGSSISYGGTFRTERESLIAVVPIGYADGLPRLVSNRGSMLLKGKRVPIAGRVCMDLTMLDVTDVSGVAMEDEVVVMGRQGAEEIRAEEIAKWAETISYEIFCGISARVPRFYL
ncbi:MAG: alanine racemase [Deltaproteobacteria bacterium GWA2_45_12]|nr:MAG: alanine racemase [Deltaproteobacteria bacterium GWA2_45_12]